MKKEIDRVLGNSLRCILPSFWWKRLLGKMVDKIESAESSASSAMKMATLAGLEASDKQSKLVSGSNIKTINNQSILGSGNITIEAGDGVEQIIFYATENDAYPLTAEEIAHNVESMQKQRTAFLNNTPVSFLVSVKGAGFQICETPSFYLPSNNTDIPVGFYIVCGGSAQVMVTCNWDGTANVKDVNWIDSELSDTSKNPVQNKAIKAYVDEKVANAGGGSLSINELDITSPAQIQGIIAKVREGEHNIYWVGSDTQSSSCLSYYIYDDLSLFVVTDDLCMSIFDLQGNKIIVDTKYRIYGLGGASTSNSKRVDKNSVMYRMIADGLISGTDCYLHYADNGKDYKVNQCEMTTVGSTTYLCLSAVADGTIIKLRMLNSGKYYDSTTEPLISFDSELSDTSTNAVQNKVIAEAVNAKADKSQIPTKLSQLEKDIEIGSSITVDSELSVSSKNAIQNSAVAKALNKKADADDWEKETLLSVNIDEDDGTWTFADDNKFSLDTLNGGVVRKARLKINGKSPIPSKCSREIDDEGTTWYVANGMSMDFPYFFIPGYSKLPSHRMVTLKFNLDGRLKYYTSDLSFIPDYDRMVLGVWCVEIDEIARDLKEIQFDLSSIKKLESRVEALEQALANQQS